MMQAAPIFGRKMCGLPAQASPIFVHNVWMFLLFNV